MNNTRKTNEIVDQELYSLFNGEFIRKNEYINDRTPLLLEHTICGYQWNTRLSRFLHSKSCPQCINKIRYNKMRKTIEDYKKEVEELEKGEYSVLGDTYVNSNTKILHRHNICGNEWLVTPHNFLSKSSPTRCPICSKKKGDKKKRKTIEQVKKEALEKRGNDFDLLIDEYSNNKQYVRIYHKTCKQTFTMRIDCFLRGDNCPICQKKYGNQISDDEYKEKVKEKYGDEYELVGRYRGKSKRITLKHNCRDGNTYVFSTYASDFLHKDRKCPRCFAANHISKAEKEMVSYIKEIYNGELIENSRNILDNNQELDIYLPEFNLAIEFDGLYYHSDFFKDDNYHYNKYLKCKEKNIRLLHIFEDEWIYKKKIIKRKLKYLLHQSEDLPKIYARNCYIKEIKYSLASRFLDTFHIQGKDKANIYLGLFYNKRLYSVMSFSKPRKLLGKNNKIDYDYELSRFASNTNYVVIGGFSKLMKYFENNYTWNSIVTYADRRLSVGDLYIKNKWKYIKENKKNYYYTDFKKRYNRSSFMKSKIKEKYPFIYSENKTEREMMKEAGYARIYDCGTITYIYERKSL